MRQCMRARHLCLCGCFPNVVRETLTVAAGAYLGALGAPPMRQYPHVWLCRFVTRRGSKPRPCVQCYRGSGIARPWHAMHTDGFFDRTRAALKPGP